MSAKLNEAPGWHALRRKDGLTIRLNVVDELSHYEVLTHDERPDLTRCECCGSVFKTVRSAQLIANIVYPMKETSS